MVFLLAAFWLLGLQPSPILPAEKQPLVVLQGPTVVAFFPPVTDAQLQRDADTNEALADFQFYATRVREPLKRARIDFHEVNAHSFRIRVGKAVTGFRPVKGDVGYYFVVPGKKPRIEYGVMSDADILQVANEYFEQASQIKDNDEVRLRATVKAVVPLSDFSGVITPVDVDPRFALTVHIESTVPAVTDFGAGAVITLGIHSPARLFVGESVKGKAYDFLLHRRIEDGKVRFLGIEVLEAVR